MTSETVAIPARFNGPLENGNGGYVSGVVAGILGDGAAEISLRRPIPLDTQLEVSRRDDGSVALLDGELLIAEGHAVPDFEIDVPAPVGPEQARQAKQHYRGLTDGLFCRCFVCGRIREDSFEVFAGSVEGRDLVATPWTPPPWTADEDGNVRPEFVWAVLDCPTYFATYDGEDLPLSMLARLTAEFSGPASAGEEHVVIAWPVEAEGRKRHAGAAVLTAGGEVLASARALMIEPRNAQPPG